MQKKRGTTSSSSRSRTVLFKQCSSDLACLVPLLPPSLKCSLLDCWWGRHRGMACFRALHIAQGHISTFCKGGLQWKQGVVICMVLYTSLLYNTTPIHCTPPPTAPPLWWIPNIIIIIRSRQRCVVQRPPYTIILYHIILHYVIILYIICYIIILFISITYYYIE